MARLKEVRLLEKIPNGFMTLNSLNKNGDVHLKEQKLKMEIKKNKHSDMDIEVGYQILMKRLTEKRRELIYQMNTNPKNKNEGVLMDIVHMQETIKSMKN